MEVAARTGKDVAREDGSPPQVPVAIVGYSYRMPGGIRTDDEFWSLLSEREIVQEPITARYGRGYRPVGEFSGPGRFASPYEGLLRDDAEKLFDRSLFGLSQNEMRLMDPQMRMLLSCAWETFERSGWDLHSLRNSRTGLFIGAQVPSVAGWRPMRGASQFDVMNVSLAMLANRISYHFNLMGPSTTYCTACSASLTALHAAMNAFRCGDCHQAVVGSVNYLGTARLSASFNALGVISPDGKCHSFDAEANGYMRSEGAFTFAIKPLEAAERDGDRICAVVEATSVNAAGAADDSASLSQGRYITAPTRHAQVELMQQACARAGRHPQEFDYIEAHATGTVVGDRVEGNAIATAFGSNSREVPLRISSVKSNVGHMEAAAFHCALLKVILMMQHRTFAPTSKNFLVPNPEIDFDRCPMQVQTSCEPFPERPVVVGINSFGFGGANGHCVVREYRPSRPISRSVPLAPEAGFMIPLSARSSEALARSAESLRLTLREQEVDLYTLAGNLGRRRTHFSTRTSFAVKNREDLTAALDAFVQDPAPVATVEEGQRRLAMVFSGQGTQWAGCGRELYEADPIFRRAVDGIEEHWREHSDISLREACFSAPQVELNEVRLAQPVIFMIQCALVELLKTWGVYPDCVVGHSSGEVAAAYASGTLSLAEATRLVFHRATLQQRTAGSGRLLAIGLDRTGVQELLHSLDMSFRFGEDGDRGTAAVEIACVNAPANTVICGKEAALRPVMEELDRNRLQNVLLPGNIAFHSAAMEPIRDAALAALSFLDDRGSDPDVPFVSSVTGEVTTRLDSAYWWSNIRQPVRFAAAMETIQREYRPDAVLEIAPHCSLQPTIAQCLESSVREPACLQTLVRDSDARLDFQEALGSLFRVGVALDFDAQYPRPEPIAHLLPGHPREEQATIETTVDNEMFVRQGEYSHGPLVGHKVPCDHILFEARLSEKDFPWLADHRVHHAAIMPAAGYIELILEALGGAPAYFEVLEFLQPCPVPKLAVRLQTALHRDASVPDEFAFSVSSRAYDVDATSELHCRGKVRLVGDDHAVDVAGRLADIDKTHFESSSLADDRNFYERLEAVLSETFQYGPFFRTIRRVLVDTISKAYLFDVEMDEGLWTTGCEEGYVSCPPLLDGGLQIFLYHLLTAADLFAIPQRAEGMTFLRRPTGPRITCHVTKPSDDWMNANERGQYSVRRGERSGGSISFYDTETGDLVAHIGEYTYFTSNPRWNDLPNSKHRIVWQPKFIPASPALIDRLPGGEIEPAALIPAFEEPAEGELHSCHVVELAGEREPDRTALKNCVDDLSNVNSQSEYWLVTDNEEAARDCYDAFHRHDAALRFASVDPSAPREPEDGLLRRTAAEIVLLHGDDPRLGPERWELARRLAVAGGLALALHDEECAIEPGPGWTTLRAGRRATLLQAPHEYVDRADAEDLPSPRWVLGERASWASEWVSLLDRPGSAHLIPSEDWTGTALQALHQWPDVADLQAIDFFCGTDAEDLVGEDLAAGFIAFVQALASHRIEQANRRCRLTVVTRRAAHTVEDPRGGALWGAARSMALEVGDDAKIDFRLVDLGDAGDLETLAWLARCDLRERELAVRDKRLWAPRMVSLKERYLPVPAAGDCTYRLVLDNAGQVAGLQMKTYEVAAPGPGDVEIDVTAAALNFRDVMVTLGLLPAMAYERSALGHEIGMEASGIVRRVGPKVRHCRVGDEVAFVAGGCIANRVTVDQSLVFAKPDGLSMEEAASTLSVYVTAYYSLVHTARLMKGQRVLIHSAMGGVGQAAIALAKHVGAEIYATAGSESKRERLLALGVRAAFDSHSFDWHDGLMAATGGEGVDVVLNSLAGRHIELCLQALRPGGWHCEIGKVDIYADNELGLRIFRKNLRFAAIDIDRLILDDPRLTRELSQACIDLIAEGSLVPLPVSAFPYADYAKAIRLMAAGQHQGKLVLTAPPDSDNPGFSIADVRPLFDPDATYLVTGALGGFGLRLLPYLVASGARHLTLMDRDPERRRDADWIRRTSALAYMDEQVEFDIMAGDVAVEDDVQRCVARIQRPLKGVFHLAGVLDDRLLDDLSAESVARVFAPKALGALHLHRATLDHALDYFVLFSSTSSALGNPGQINYSAANGYLDGLAASRRRQGLPCLAYNMAAVADAGMAARSLPVLRMMRAAGLPPVSSDCAIANLDYALRALSDRDHLICALFERPLWTVDFADYMRIGRLMRNRDAFEAGPAAELTVEAVVAQIAAKVAELCGHEESGAEEPLSSFGLTSLSVAELGTFIQTEFNYRVSALELMTTASALSLAQGIVLGPDEAAEDSDDTGVEAVAEVSAAAVPRARRKPSIFASPPESHFPDLGDAGATQPAARQA